MKFNALSNSINIGDIAGRYIPGAPEEQCGTWFLHVLSEYDNEVSLSLDTLCNLLLGGSVDNDIKLCLNESDIFIKEHGILKCSEADPEMFGSWLLDTLHTINSIKE